MHNFIRKIRKQAGRNPKRIVLPQGIDDRVLKATEVILNQSLAHPILLGNSSSIKSKAKKLGLKIDWKKVQIINPAKSKLSEEYAKKLYKLRKEKGLSLKKSRELIKDQNYFGTMMIEGGGADGMVTGTTNSTADSIRPALQIIKTKELFHKVSGVFFLVLEKRLLLFADTAINIEPNSHELKEIALDTAETAKKFGITPKIAFLSFSTRDSAHHPLVEKIKEATNMLKYERPDLTIDGELQVDAALAPRVTQRKCPNSPLKGQANILIFPNLEAGNIAYKLVEHLAKAKAIGPILQGLKKPVNDLSRGCSEEDIVNVTAFTVCECQSE